MKNLFTTLFAMLALFLLTPASASTIDFGASTVDTLSQPLVCAEEEKKKKEEEEDEEPECD